jgi:hypothetical protein
MANEDFESQEELGLGGKVKNWIQDNIRIIISVLIVIVIAGGIYSYSNRTQEIVFEDDLVLEDEFVIDEEQTEDEAMEEEGEESTVDNSEKETEETVLEAEEEVQVNEEPAEKEVEVISQETGDSFIEKAFSGDSKTTLARKALASYLEKNNDSELTAEHKIYIEDYLRKNVNYTGGVRVGTEISFSKNLIKNSIEKAKTLTDSQLGNLKKYSARVPSLK